MATKKEETISGIALYDYAIWNKINKYFPQLEVTSAPRIFKPDQTDLFIKVMADESKDDDIKFPLIMINREKDIELLQNIKNFKSFNGNTLYQDSTKTLKSNVIPIKLEYQLNIFTASYNTGCEYVRALLFKLINNPVISIVIPYQGTNTEYIANIRVSPTVSDISDMSQRLFPGQFTCWAIKLEIQDACLFNVPVRSNWTIDGASVKLFAEISDEVTVEEETSTEDTKEIKKKLISIMEE